MKRVGIFLRDYKSISNNDLLAIRKDLFAYLSHYNIEIICIPISYETNEYDAFDRVEKLIKECDGIILPGGEKDYEIDLKIAKYLYNHDIPTLGICLGMQIMALAFNGDLGHLETNAHQSAKEYVHEIKIKENSRLFQILKEHTIMVNSRHSDYITTTDLPIVAIANDLTIEAVEDEAKKFFIGVQWHPESLSKNIYSKRLFDFFINSL